MTRTDPGDDFNIRWTSVAALPGTGEGDPACRLCRGAGYATYYDKATGAYDVDHHRPCPDCNDTEETDL